MTWERFCGWLGRCVSGLGYGLAGVLQFAVGVTPQTVFNILPTVKAGGVEPGTAEFGMLVLLALSAGFAALLSIAWRKAETRGQRFAIVLVGVFIVLFTYSQGLALGENMRDAYAEKVRDAAAERARIERQTGKLRDEQWAPVGYTATDDAMVKTAKAALNIATENRRLECSESRKGPGPNCQRDKQTELNALALYDKRLADQAAGNRKKEIDKEMGELEDALKKLEKPPEADPHMKAIAIPLGLFVDLDAHNPAATVGKWWPHYVALTMEVMTWGFPLLMWIVMFGRGLGGAMHASQQNRAASQNARAHSSSHSDSAAVPVPAVPAVAPAVLPADGPAVQIRAVPDGRPDGPTGGLTGGGPDGLTDGGPDGLPGGENRSNIRTARTSGWSSRMVAPDGPADGLPDGLTGGGPDGGPAVAGGPSEDHPDGTAEGTIRAAVSNAVADWFRACTRPASGTRLRPRDDLYPSYASWCHKRWVEPLHQQVFVRHLKAIPGVTHEKLKDKSGTVFVGFALVAQGLRIAVSND